MSKICRGIKLQNVGAGDVLQIYLCFYDRHTSCNRVKNRDKKT